MAKDRKRNVAASSMQRVRRSVRSFTTMHCIAVLLQPASAWRLE